MLTTPESNDEISLLDILVVLAESFWLLLLAPLAIGAIAFGIASSLPKTYESVAVLQPPATLDEFGNLRGENSATMLARLNAPELQVLAADSQAWIRDRQLGPREMQSFLKDVINVRADRQSGLVTVTTYGPTAADARSLLQALLESYLADAAPRGSAREQILQRIEVLRGALAILDPAIAIALNVDEETGKVRDLATAPASRPALADLVAQRTANENAIRNLENTLSITMQDIILQAPTLEENPVRPKRLQITAIAVILSGLALTVLVFIRAALRAAAHDPEGAPKIARIRKGILRF